MPTDYADVKTPSLLRERGLNAVLRSGGNLGALIGDLDWSATPLGALASWPQSMLTALSICLNSPVVSALYWGADFRVIYNDAYAPALAERHPSALGQPLSEVWSEIWDVLGPQLQSVLATGDGFAVSQQRLIMHRHGRDEETFWDYSFSPIRDETGDVGGVFVHASDVTATVRAERRLAEHARSQETMLESMPGFSALLKGPNHIFEFANHAYRQIVGQDNLVGRRVRDVLPELEGQGYLELLDKVFQTGAPFMARAMPLRIDGDERDRFIDYAYQPLIDESGEVTGIYVSGYEVTDHVEAIARVSESQEELQTLTDALPVLISYIDADRRYRFNNRIYEDWFPKRRKDIEGQTVESVVGEKAYAAVKPWMDRALAGERVKFEQMMPYSTTRHRHIQVEYVPRLTSSGSALGFYALVQDVSATKALEAQRAELTNELSHRIKNSLAVVQAIVTQTLRQAETMEEARDAIGGRVAALSRAQDILIDTSWVAAEIGDVVRSALSPYEDGGGRFDIAGDEIQLTAQQSLGLSLAIHELATNAIKYGALSNDVGIVSIRWRADELEKFQFDWIETGGPMVRAPTRTGFGSKLIERIVAPYFKGESIVSYDPTGVHFALRGHIGAS